MIRDLLFDVIFVSPDGTEAVPDNWTGGSSMGYPY